jgi:aromatic ring-opening dioxygenase LigB subunit
MMAGLVFACIAPHGFTLIPSMSEDADGALATRAAMFELGQRCVAAQPDVIVLATPHGLRVDDTICVAATARAAGVLAWNGRSVDMHVPVDAELTDAICARARELGVPIARASYAGNRRDQSVLPLDWGAITPLWFLGHRNHPAGSGDVLADPPETQGPPVVLVAPSRSLPRSAMLMFGRAVAEAAAQDGRRVAFVASCDWSHTHKASGPYGFHPAAAVVDAIVLEAVRTNRLAQLSTLSDQLAEDAAIDGLWQALMLAGAQEHTPMQVELLSYEAPTYYGMLVAAFTPTTG